MEVSGMAERACVCLQRGVNGACRGVRVLRTTVGQSHMGRKLFVGPAAEGTSWSTPPHRKSQGRAVTAPPITARTSPQRLPCFTDMPCTVSAFPPIHTVAFCSDVTG